MATWTYPVTDFRTGAVVHDGAPLIVESFTDALGVAQGGLTGKLQLSKLGAAQADDVLLPWRRVVWPCKAGRPHGAFVITAHAPFGPKSTTVDFAAQRVDVVFARREIWSTLVFRQVDQLLIARNIMGYALGLTPLASAPDYMALISPLPAASVPWLLLDNTYSGVLRDRLDDNDGYQAATHRKVSDALTSLSQLEGGFEYRLDYARDSTTGALTATVRLGYPQLGRASPAIGFEYPGNSRDWSYAQDTADTATMARAFGAGQGVERTISLSAIDTTAHNQGWPLLMGSESSTASIPATLDAGARAFLAEHQGVNEGWTIQLDGSVLGTFDIGDQALARVSSPRWGTAYQLVRITGLKVEPSRPGRAERVTPTVVGVGPIVTKQPAPPVVRGSLATSTVLMTSTTLMTG